MEIRGPTRVRVFLPVKSRNYRQLHNRIGIAMPRGPNVHTPEMVVVYFAEGSIISIHMHQDYLVEP